ncbi:hypothetical protein BH09MYX1_BH09MYX1_13130 [soil metagenome]
MLRLGSLAAGFVSVAFALSLASSASANPKVLPFSYGTNTNPGGQGEVETYVDLVPLRARSGTNGAEVKYLMPQIQTEFEWGLTDRLELGLYVTFTPRLGDAIASYPVATEANGAKARFRYRFADEGDWPIDVGVYAEVVANDREFELEAKILLQKRIKNLLVVSNLWVEHEFYYDGRREWVFNPTFGFQYQVTPSFFPGIELWTRMELPANALADVQPKPFNFGPHAFLGPTMMVDWGRFFLTTGFYMRLTDFGRTTQIGDGMGAMWYRLIIGFQI